MKETFYFSHDYNARNDQKILMLRGEFGTEGYGLYWMLLETLSEDSECCIYRLAMAGLSVSFNCPISLIQKFIDFCIKIELFFEEDGKIFSKRMLEHKELRAKLSQGGKKGAELRWGSNSSAMAEPMQRKGKERKEKETLIDIAKPAISEYKLEVTDSVNIVMNKFYEINPGLNFANKTQRKAVEELINKFTLEKLLSMLVWYFSKLDDKFCPVATTPLAFKEKIGDIKVFADKLKNNNIVTDLGNI